MGKHTPACAESPSTIPFPRSTPPKVDFQFTMIPDTIMRDTDLYPGAKLLFGVILSSCRRGRCFMGNAELARACGLSVKQTRRLFAALEGRGLIVRDLDGKRREQIRITCPNLGHTLAPSCPQVTPQVIQKDAPSRGTDSENDGEKGSEAGFSFALEKMHPDTQKWFGHLINTTASPRGESQ
jgi:predicted transcriptional regulator